MYMAVFKFVISDGEKSYQIEKDQKDCPVIGKKIGDIILVDFLGLSDYELQITGGSDKDGFPMRKDVEGGVRKKFIVTKGIGFKTNISGLRRRKMLRGNTIGVDIVQINCKVVKKGEKPLEEILGKREAIEEIEKVEEVAKEEKVKEEAKEIKKEEKRKEVKEEKKEEAKPKFEETVEKGGEAKPDTTIKEKLKEEKKAEVEKEKK
jgi:small subunit ribosomal protein S6e